MVDGAVTFKGGSISNSKAVRAARRGDASRTDAQLGRVSADGVRRPISIRAAAPACAQDSGGVVDMSGGAVMFKGGSISNSTAAVRAPSASRASRAVVWYVSRCGTADG
jgi:hypothetical protein